jgi:hypothetical protein
MKEQIETKRCPFCNFTATERQDWDGYYYIMCDYCEVRTQAYDNLKSAADAWNDRRDVSER